MTRKEFDNKFVGYASVPQVFAATPQTPEFCDNSAVSRDHTFVSVACQCGHEYLWSEYPVRYSDAARKAVEWAAKPCEACAPPAPAGKTQAQILAEIEQDRLAGRTKYDNR